MIARLALFACLPFFQVSAREIDLGKLLDSIREVEGSKGRDGAAGERGPYQFTREAWAETTKLPFWFARIESVSRAMAMRRMTRFAEGLERLKWEVSPYNLALIWNAGLGATLREKTQPRHRNYAGRVDNLYREKIRRAFDAP